MAQGRSLDLARRTMKVVIFGSRYKDLEYERARLLQTRIWNRTKRLPRGSFVITGGAPGVDKWAERARKLQGFDGEVVYAEWRDKYGAYNPRAGFERNSKMLAMEPVLAIGYWDGESNGTHDTAKKAVALGIRVEMHLNDGATVIDDWKP